MKNARIVFLATAMLLGIAIATQAQSVGINSTDSTPNSYYYHSGSSIGTDYGSEISFTTTLPTVGTVVDNDGNRYNYITIGTQTWMVENLKTTKYRNGEAISNVTDNDAWAALALGAYCWYNNDISNKAIYGGLYNWYAVADSRNIAPVGWHVATDAEWTTLINYLGGAATAGGYLKETGTTHWNSPNTGADNSSGFSALPGGGRHYSHGSFGNFGTCGYWWSTTAIDATLAWYRILFYRDAEVNSSFLGGKQHGLSVRCVRD